MNSFMVQLVQGAYVRPDSGDAAYSGQSPQGEVAGTRRVIPFSDSSLEALPLSSIVRESQAVTRISQSSAPSGDVVTFAAKNRSRWALDVLSQRLTRNLLDWEGLRAELLHDHAGQADAASPALRITPTKLWMLRQALASQHLDPEVEFALLIAVADRVLAGERFDKSALPALAVNLIGAGLDERVRQLLDIYTNDSYLRHALTVELGHPRFGGSHDLVLARFNQIYRRFGLETVGLDGAGSVPFTQLRAQPAERVEDGPLVSIIMSCWSPGEHLLLAVRSIVDQTYQNWELLVTDDASPGEFGHVLDAVEKMDPRVRVLRNELNAGTYIRRNEALDLARGELVTMQDSDDFSHPRRLEIQVRNLEQAPERLANIVYNVRLTEDLSLYSERGMQLGLCEPAIMFRRKPVLAKIGYFDDVRKAADREFRQRLEAATGVPVTVVGPEIPLVLMLADVGSLSGSDFRGKWVHPARIAYRSSMVRAHELIKDGEQSAVFPPRQTTRVLDAPEALLGRSTTPSRLDLLVVLDGRTHAGRRSFLAGVVEELRAALEAGLVVGVKHSDSLLGGKQQGYFDAPLQRLVDEEGLHRIIDGQQITVGTVVVRHAVAAQGHNAEPLEITADQVVIIEDKDGGDERGATFARADVAATVTAWFGATPEWHVAAQRPLPPTIESVVVDSNVLRVALKHSSSSGPLVIELRGSTTLPMTQGPADAAVRAETPDQVERLTVVQLPLADIGKEPFQLVALLGQYTYVLDVEVPRVLTLAPSTMLVRRPNQRLQLIATEVADGATSGAGDGSMPKAKVNDLQVVDGRMLLEISADEHSTKLTQVVAVRDVHGQLRRRGFALKVGGEGLMLASRQIEPLAGLRWRIFGVFQTPFGRVQRPLSFDTALRTAVGDGWQLRPVGDDVISVIADSQQGGGATETETPALRSRPLSRWLRRSKASA